MPLPNLGALSLRAAPTGEFCPYVPDDYPDEEWDGQIPVCAFTLDPVKVGEREDKQVLVTPQGDESDESSPQGDESDESYVYTPDDRATFRLHKDHNHFEWYEASWLAEMVRRAIEAGEWPKHPCTRAEMRPSDVRQLLMVYPTRNPSARVRAQYATLVDSLFTERSIEINQKDDYLESEDITDAMRDNVRAFIEDDDESDEFDAEEDLFGGSDDEDDSEEQEEEEVQEGLLDEETIGILMDGLRHLTFTQQTAALVNAIRNGRNLRSQGWEAEMIALLRLRVANPNTATPVTENTVAHVAAERRSRRLLFAAVLAGCNVDMQNAEGDTPLTLAASRRGSFLVVHLLLREGANARYSLDGHTALHIAVEVDVVYALLDAAQPPSVNAQTERGETPLYLAVQSKSIELVQGLLAVEANPNLPDERGETPLHTAVERRTSNFVHSLLEFGADPNLQDNEGRTPLHVAVTRSALGEAHEMIEMLLRRGASPDIADDAGRTPLDVARATLAFSRDFWAQPILFALRAAQHRPDEGE